MMVDMMVDNQDMMQVLLWEYLSVEMQGYTLVDMMVDMTVDMMVDMLVEMLDV